MAKVPSLGREKVIGISMPPLSAALTDVGLDVRLNQAVWLNQGMEIMKMKDEQFLDRIVLNPKVMVGKATIKGTRLTVEYVLNLLAHGTTVEEILAEYEGITQADIQACLLFATRSLENTTFMPLAETA
jgi:uncharacterized protein (DUF433 family)